MADKKFYWLKLNKDFFDRHEVKIIEAHDAETILFYIKLMCESVSHNGKLRFSDKVPYTREMLSFVTNTPIEIVDDSMDLFLELGLVEVEEDGTYVMTKVPDMVGSETAWAEKKRAYREKKEGQDEDKAKTMSSTKKTMSDKSIEYRDKSIENIGYINSLVYEEDVDRISASASASPIRELYPDNLDEILTLWNQQAVTKNIKSIPIMGKRIENTRLCLQYVDSYKDFLNVIRDIDHHGFFRKQAETGKKLSYDWFCDPNNFLKIIEGNYKETYGRSAVEGMVKI